VGAGEDVGEGFLEIEGAGVYVGVVDEAVAAEDIMGEVGEGFSPGGGSEPESELGDFDGFGGEVHAEKVIVEDKIGDLVV